MEILKEYRERVGEISRSLLIEIAAVEDPARQLALWQRAKQGLSIREVRAEKKGAQATPRHRPPSLKAVGLALGRMVGEVDRLGDIRRQLQPEHRDQLRALREKIDALLAN